jgi:biopolymer transport protein ExbD
MALRKKKRGLPDIPTSSMSDIVFLLLVFFLVTTSFNMEKGLDLQLPPPGGEVEIRRENISNIFVNPTGRMRFDETVIDNADQIVELTEQKLSTNKDHIFVIHVDRDGQYQHMITVLDKLKKADAKKIALATHRQN